jgi:glucose-6-phosphate dehydrogenase assembly protein OpcA
VATAVIDALQPPMTWRGEGVRGAEVLAALDRLWREERRRAREEGAPEARSSVSTLVVHAPDDAALREADALTAALPGLGPSRTVIVARGAAGSGIDARVDVRRLTPAGGPALHADRVVMVARGETGARLKSLVLPLLLPDLPTVLYWQGEVPLGQRWLDDWGPIVDLLVVDSACCVRPSRDLAGLRGIVAAGTAVADLGWERLAPWREALAAACDPPEVCGRLPELSAIRLAVPAGPSGAAAPGAETVALLLVGWLATCLHLTATGPAAAAPLRRAERAIAVALTPAGARGADGAVPVGVELVLGEGDAARSVRLGLGEGGDGVVPPPRDTLEARAHRLARAMARGPDARYRPALRLAAQLAARRSA